MLESPSVSDCGGIDDININPDLTVVQQAHVREINSDYSDTFTTRPGCTTLIEHNIKLTTDTTIRVKQYPLPFSTMETIKDEIKEMIDLDIDEPSDSPYYSPVLVVKKKDNSNGFCIDIRVLNKVAVVDAEPMPNMEEIFTKIAGHKYISKLDLTRGYWQVRL